MRNTRRKSIYVYNRYFDYNYDEYKKKKKKQYQSKHSEYIHDIHNIFSEKNKQIPYEQNDMIFKLDSVLKNQFETAFDEDLSDVEIHLGPYADYKTNEYKSDAVAFKNKIYFKSGKYNTSSIEGIRLLAHELQHVIQYKHEVRMTYNEDIQKLENESIKVESEIVFLKLNKINMPLLNQLNNISFDEKDMADIKNEVIDEAELDINSINSPATLDDFRSRDCDILYNITFRNGNKATLTKEEYDLVILKTISKFHEYIYSKRNELTEDEYDKFILKVMKFLDK